MLKKLCGDKWIAPALHAADSSRLTLGPRAYLELMSFLRDLDIKKCAICQSEMLQGVPCGRACATLLHHSCLARYTEKGLQYKCATCKLVIRPTARAPGVDASSSR
ncbi:hypothetical protein P43SY_009705 [Pythium insidiosum]|uniref:Uncharacterized protein n=1 Tax=Pythium insidiosum TaxID=114742 RepID=A0AAD5LXD6_PYTIN|nr:hypothetical protein P43SY_009705 [Pythium insidiosum]